MTDKVDLKDINWNVAETHARRMAGICNSGGYSPPEIYRQRLQEVCVQIDGVAQALKLVPNADKKTDEILALLRDTVALPGNAAASLATELESLRPKLVEIINKLVV